jgi:peptidyl-prolyl cis-trans isomerase SurA
MIKVQFVFLNILFFIFQQNTFAINGSNIILKVENEIITSYEIKNKIVSTLILSNQEINQMNIDKMKRKTLDSLIQYKLKKIELSKYNFKNDDTQINDYLKTISGNNIKVLKEKFAANDLDFQLFLEGIEIQFKWQKLIYNIYANKIELDESALNKELNEIIKKNSKIEEFKISEIEILINNNDTDKERILNIENLIKNENFGIIALNHSISSSSLEKGDLGWVSGGTLSKEIYNIIKKMNVGETSKPIKRQNSVLFLKLVNKKISNSNEINISKLKENLINKKKNDLFNLYSLSHVSKLKNTSLIEYK